MKGHVMTVLHVQMPTLCIGVTTTLDSLVALRAAQVFIDAAIMDVERDRGEPTTGLLTSDPTEPAPPSGPGSSTP